jgi:hypothetical protein
VRRKCHNVEANLRYFTDHRQHYLGVVPVKNKKVTVIM